MLHSACVIVTIGQFKQKATKHRNTANQNRKMINKLLCKVTLSSDLPQMLNQNWKKINVEKIQRCVCVCVWRDSVS